MIIKKLDSKKNWLKRQTERTKWKIEVDLQHRWSMFALEIGTILLAAIAIFKLL